MNNNNKTMEYRDLNPNEKELLAKVYKADYTRIGPKGYIVPTKYKCFADDIYNMEVKPDDVFIVTFQRSGTTLTQELVWLISNNFDYDTASKVLLTERVPFLEFACYYDDNSIKRFYDIAGDSEQTKKMVEKWLTPVNTLLETIKSPRYIKTHLPMSLLPPKLLNTGKVVYVARDPRDVIVSSYHNARLFKTHAAKGDVNDMLNVFLNDLMRGAPYFEHVKEAWNLRHHPNMLFLFYEDITKNMPETIQKVAKFLGKSMTEADIARLCDHLNVENFKKNKSVNLEQMRESGLLDRNETFVRKGKSGGWREYFDEDMTARVQKWIEDNIKGTDLRYPSIHVTE